MAQNRVFICYSHKDAKWLDRVQVHLKPLVRDGSLDVWDDTKIAPGSKWQTEIESALANATIAVLLVSADFLASDYIANEELPRLLQAAENRGARIFPLIVSASMFANTKLGTFQAVNDPSAPLNTLAVAQQEVILAGLGQTVDRTLNP